MITLTVSEGRSQDVGLGLARIDPADMAQIGVNIGDVLSITGEHTTLAKVVPAHPDQRGKGIIQIDGTIRTNAQIHLDDEVTVQVATVKPANSIALEPVDGQPMPSHFLRNSLLNLPVITTDVIRIARMSAAPQYYRITATDPGGAVLITPSTTLSVMQPPADKASQTTTTNYLSYEDIGGLDQEIQRVREMVELPMRFPQVFQHLGISPPKGLLLSGPPGTGKTLIARALARETNAYFTVINGPEIMDKFYGQSEGALRNAFDEAQRNAPAIIFIDEIDAIAPPRDQVQGEVEKRVVAQLLTLMDGLEDRGDLVVIAATNLPDRIDPALRRPGRFDREIHLRVPDRAGREAILAVHTRGMPLANDVDLSEIATLSNGYVGADLQAICREAAMNALRHMMLEDDVPGIQQIMQLRVHMVDFRQALAEITPSTTRGITMEVPDVKWDDVGGLHDAKVALQQAIEWPLLYPEQFAAACLEPPRGILLSGPPGTGKTLLAKAVANALQVNFIGVRGPEVMSKWVGDSEKRVRELFRTARNAAPCVIFFDEFDAIAPIRTGTDPVTERIVAQILTEMDGLEAARGVIVLAATNRADLIDPALRRPGRFDLHFEIGLPDANARAHIFSLNMEKRPISPEIDMDALIAHTENWSGAQITEWCRRAALQAVTRAIETEQDVLITAEDFANEL